MHSRRIRWAAISIAALALTGCGSTRNGTALPGEIDVRKLDVGSYNTDPLDLRYHYFHALDNGTTLATMRLAGQVVVGPDVDPKLKYGTGTAGFSDTDGATQVLAANAAPALTGNGMMFGVAASAADSLGDAGKRVKEGMWTSVVVMQFPDDASAAKAATELDDADFAVAADVNQRVSLPKYAAAHTHWRPGIASIGTYMAHGSYVIHVFAGVKDPNLDQLSALTQQVLDAQVPLLDSLKPLDREAILRLDYDPDGMLRQTLSVDGLGMPDLTSEAVYEPRGFIQRVKDQSYWQHLLTASGVDRFSLSGYNTAGITMLFRARDPQAAKQLWSAILDPAYPGAADAPPVVPDAKCGESATKDDLTIKRYRCAVVYRRYVATVESDQLADVQQRAAAQYALMANSTW
ncbi:hypothetical protein [Nocardia sp. NPDC020380]|uniref:DUF7373 family lipoprotein n=1 Tax=Nocardia sp. NPDC020380 TaxID=3364309 RepID=UPI0037B4E87B